MQPGDTTGLIVYVVGHANRYGLDPRAALAVSTQEGWSGGIGDNGTSFGPWQLHQGGDYPASAPQSPAAANAWAWSPAGIDYALAGMSQAAGGQKGLQSVHSIVYGFERPANPAAEYAGAARVYGDPAFDREIAQAIGRSLGLGAGGSGYAGPAGPVASTVGGVVSGVESVSSFLGLLTSASFWIRALEVVGGGVLLLLGLYLLARSAGAAPRRLPTPVGAVGAELARTGAA